MILRDAAEVRERLHLRPPAGVADAALVDVLARTGVLLDGHFVLQSGAHSPTFIRFDRLGWDRSAVREVARWLLAHLGPLEPGAVVLCPESAGFLLGEAVAAEAGAALAVVRVDERRRPTDRLRREVQLEGRSVVVVNDVATTGSGLLALADVAGRHGARVGAALVLAALQAGAVEAALRRRAIRGEWLAAAAWPTFAEADCPLCARGAPSMAAAELN